MIGRPDVKFEIYNYLKKISQNLNDALDKAFEFIKSKSFYQFDDDFEIEQMKKYLKILLLKSNAGLLYDFDLNCKLKTPVSLIKTSKYMYRNGLDDLYVKKDFDSDDEFKLEIDQFDYSLNEIANNVDVFECKNGNHWTFISECSVEITNFIIKIINFNKSKI